MTSDQDIVRQLQRHLRTWNPNEICSVHSYLNDKPQRCKYDEQGRLTDLHLCGLDIVQIPSEIWLFSLLQKLWLSKNQINDLAREVGRLSSLILLSLDNNQLSNLPGEVGQLSVLSQLSLDNNQLSNLPKEVSKLSTLESLTLSNNRFSSFPIAVCQLFSLKGLFLGNNQLSSLPVEVGKLTGLRTLSLGGNRFDSFPIAVCQLSSLRWLLMRDNQLRSLPVAVCQLTSLQVLDLENNPLQSPPPEIVEQGTSAILAYLQKLQQIAAIEEIVREKRERTIKETLPIKIFYCYAHEDKDLRDRLDGHLSILKRLGNIVGWYDREIQAGIEWEREIEAHLSTASIILLLVSSDFLKSDYCYGVEMQKALEMHEKGKARVLPILLRPVYWQGAPFAKLQILPTGAKPITEWQNQDKALTDVAEQISAVVTALRT